MSQIKNKLMVGFMFETLGCSWDYDPGKSMIKMKCITLPKMERVTGVTGMHMDVCTCPCA